MQVVWQESPGASSQPLGRTLSNLGRTGVAGGPGPGLGAQEFSAIKQRLISAAQKPRDVRRPPGPALAAAAGARMQQQSEQLLEGLLARQQPAGAAAQQQQQHSGQSAAASGDAGAACGASAHRTPAAHLRGILKRRGSGPGGSGGRTPVSSVKFTTTGSGCKGGRSARGGAAGGHLGSSGKKRQAGQKRKALLELLEQVENIVQSGGSSPEGGEEDQEEQQQQHQHRQMRPPAVPAVGGDGGTASDKENAAAATGPTGSQQLMPPPGGVRCCGNAQQQQQQPVQHLKAGPQPAGAAGAAQPQRSQQLAQAMQPGQTLQPAQQGDGGFEEEEEGDDDAMMLEVLTQVEQKYAAKQAAAAATTQLSRGVQQRPAAAAQAALPRPQAAPPVAQHPVKEEQQQPADQPKALPRSPYGRGAPPPAGPEQQAAVVCAPAQAPKPAAADASDGSWDDDGLDDDGFDLVAQLEAAALKERADRSLKGEPSTSGAGTSIGPLAAEGGERPPSGGAPAAPRFAGNREEVHYKIREIFPAAHEQVLLLHNTYQVWAKGGCLGCVGVGVIASGMAGGCVQERLPACLLAALRSDHRFRHATPCLPPSSEPRRVRPPPCTLV